MTSRFAQRRSTGSRLPQAAIVVCALGLSPSALAAPPTIQQCLDASDASLALEAADRLLATREALRTCASLSCPQEVRDECARRLDLVEQTIPSVACEVRDLAGRLRSDVPIVVDGGAQTVTSGELVELDPGTHTFAIRPDGARPETQTLSLGAREKKRNLRFVLSTPAYRGSTQGLPARRTVALVAGGIGVASWVTAAAFAFIALERKREAREVCPASTCPSALGAERWQSAWQAGNFTTGFAIGGAVATAAAAGLWFSVDSRAGSVAIGPAQVQWKARF